ncbi:MAG: hypothetical protein HN368_11485 [Spirochaetales bacterium]|nr:hypothetical protein [Spirochaetales bacterium]
MVRKYITILIFITCSQVSFSAPIEVSFGTKFTFENLGIHSNLFIDEERASYAYFDDVFGVKADASLMGGGKYYPHTDFQLGHYFFINEASFSYNLGNVSLFAGYMPHSDVVDSPYSIFISSETIPVLNAGFTFAHDKLFFESRWVRLNERSANQYNGKSETYRDRGLSFKAFSIDFGNFTLGFEDSYIYLDKTFDAESFLSPIPMFLYEMVLGTPGRPWTQANNTNAIMGFFGEWENDYLYLESQLLVDDSNASILAPILGKAIPSLNSISNLQKLAWGIGGHLDTPSGTFGFYHSGATKYTFEATYVSVDNYSTVPYEYTYYPATEYEDFYGSMQTIRYQENYIGYKYGENNVAFLFDYTGIAFSQSLWSFDLYSSLEWVINGAKSPANPWHEYDSWLEIEPRYELLSDPVLEHQLLASMSADKKRGNFDFGLDVSFGYVWNRLRLEELVAGEPKIYVPRDGDNGVLFSVSLFIRYGVEL